MLKLQENRFNLGNFEKIKKLERKKRKTKSRYIAKKIYVHHIQKTR